MRHAVLSFALAVTGVGCCPQRVSVLPPPAFAQPESVVLEDPGLQRRVTLADSETEALLANLNEAWESSRVIPRSGWRPRTAPGLVIRLQYPHGKRTLGVFGPQDALHDTESEQVALGPFPFCAQLAEHFPTPKR